MRRSWQAVAVALVLVAGAAVACSDDPYADYCDVVSENQDELTRILGEGGPDVLLRALPIFRELQEAAPSDIRDDWRIVVSGLDALESALDDAGGRPGDVRPREAAGGRQPGGAGPDRRRRPGAHHRRVRRRVRRRRATGPRRLQDPPPPLTPRRVVVTEMQ